MVQFFLSYLKPASNELSVSVPSETIGTGTRLLMSEQNKQQIELSDFFAFFNISVYTHSKLASLT